MYGRAGQIGIIDGGGRKGMGNIAWHPDNVSYVRCIMYSTCFTPKQATRFMASSGSGDLPVVMVWDSRKV